ncbi:MAG TPA: M20/M25/M40 family metallo-hydrolase, partial [Gemmatimonadales bacterium]|nr:M20/M25/M40 family metallo-hydrolase [Gemmatimonadales bacterium]
LTARPPVRLSAQDLPALATRLATMTAVSGYESAIADSVQRLLPGATRDRLGNVILTLGTGEPRRLLSCGLDEPGYVVGNITDDGYLRLRREGTGRGTSPLFDQQIEGQRVTVWGRRGGIPGVVAVRSVHLTRGRGAAADQPFTVDDAWVDVGVTSRAQAESLGILLLSPVALTKRPTRYGPNDGLLAGPFAGRRAACAALLFAATGSPKVQGTVVVAFTVQTMQAGRPGVAALAALHGPFSETKEATVPGAFGETAVETVSLDAVQSEAATLRTWLGPDAGALPSSVAALHPRPVARPPAPIGRVAEAEDVIRTLVEAYGVSGSEGPVRDAVSKLLPSWTKQETDTAGNLWVKVGTGDPPVVFVAHMDEIGFRVDSIRGDGTLALTTRGGFFPSLFEGKPALVHGAKGDIAGVFLPRDSGSAATRTPPANRVSVGATTAADASALGVAPGQTVTMPKQFVRLAGTRATGRSFDDRVGDAAFVLALRHLDRTKLRHAVVFIFSTREEIGLEGAKAAAAALGTTTARVHAVDTFVSADSPLEPTNFADAPLGRGAVARALDNSSVTPLAQLDTLLRVARTRGIALQYGTTNGGNDGSMFVPYGVIDVAMGWPLRYSHSPAEVIDLKDLVSLGDLVRAVAEDW